MYIAFGSRNFGKTDLVPGFFHVVTRFGHIYYIPLLPTKSFLFVSETRITPKGISISVSDRAVPITLSAKSLLLAWGRAAAIFIASACTVTGIVFAAGDPAEVLHAVIAFTATALVTSALILSYKLKYFTHASPTRALALAQKANVTPETLAALRRHFNLSDDYSPNHGFPITPTSPDTTPNAPFPPERAE